MPNTTPKNTEAERAFLGSMLIYPLIIPQATVTPSQFYDLRHRETWKAILDLYNDGREIDIVTVSSQLKNVSPSYLTELINASPTSLNWEEYQTEIIKADYSRLILEEAGKLAKLALSGEDIALSVSNVVSKITQSTPTQGKGLRQIGDTMTAVIETVQARAADPDEVWGIPTGFENLDAITGGWHKGQLSIIAGEPGIGKTRLVTQAITHATSPQNGYTGFLFSSEMTEEEIDFRVVSVEGGINLRSMETGRMGSEDWESFYSTIASLSGYNLFLDETSQPSPAYISSEIAKKRAEGIAPDLVVVDYIYQVALALMQSNTRLDEDVATQIVAAQLKALAKDQDVAVVAVSSIVKAGMDSRGSAKMSWLRGGGQQIHEADLVVFLTEDDTNPTLVNAKIVKGRHLRQRRLTFDLLNDTDTPRLISVQTTKVNLNQLVK